MTQGGVETGLKKADTGLKVVERNIGLKKGDIKTRMMREQLQLEVEPPSETRPEQQELRWAIPHYMRV